MKTYSVTWRKDDLKKKAPERLAHALSMTGEDLDGVIRSGLLDFIDCFETGQCTEEYPKYSSGKLL